MDKMKIEAIDVLDRIIIGRVDPHIYAFTTNTVPNYLKVGDTYRPVSQRLNEWRVFFPELEKQYENKAVIDEETFTPRISKSDWEIYKLYYPTVKKPMIDKEVTSYEINPIVICMKEDKVVILDDDYFEDFYDFVEEYAELRDDVLEENRFFLNMLHKISQSLYKHVRLLIGEHDNIETVLREQQSNEKLISLSEVEQGFYVYNIAMRNLNYVVENTNGKLENGYLTSSLRMGISGAAIVFIPKGVTLPTVQGFVDGSDNTKDRILITQSASPQSDAKQFYYKAD